MAELQNRQNELFCHFVFTPSILADRQFRGELARVAPLRDKQKSKIRNHLVGRAVNSDNILLGWRRLVRTVRVSGDGLNPPANVPRRHGAGSGAAELPGNKMTQRGLRTTQETPRLPLRSVFCLASIKSTISRCFKGKRLALTMGSVLGSVRLPPSDGTCGLGATNLRKLKARVGAPLVDLPAAISVPRTRAASPAT